MKRYSYPNPGSFNEFCGRNPGIIEHAERLGLYERECALWRATGDDIDMVEVILTDKEKLIMTFDVAARKKGAKITQLYYWPPVGEYDVPPELVISEA